MSGTPKRSLTLAWVEDRALVGLLLVLAVLAAHLPAVLGATFHFDDHHNLVENEAVRSLGNIPRFFADPQTWSAERGNTMYRPLQTTSYAFDFALWGLRSSGWALTNALLHAAVAVLVWRLAARIGLSPLASAFAGAVMALHPAHSEVVNYVSSRSESLAALVMLLALHAHLSARTRSGWACAGFAALAALLAALSMTAKETTALFFVAVAWMELLLSRGGLGTRTLRAVGAAAFYWVAFWGVMAVRGAVLEHATAAVALTGTAPNADFRAGGSISILDNLLFVQSRVVVLYLQILVRPVALNVDYDVARAPFWSPAVVAALVIHAAVGAWALAAGLRGRRLLPLTVGWFWLFLAPSIAFPLNVVMNEHRLYLPGIAVALLAGAALARVAELLAARWGTLRGAAVAAAPLALFVPLCVQRGLEWHDDLTLWTRAVERAPGSARAHMHLGAAYQTRSRATGAPADLTLVDRALAEYREAEKLYPDWYDTQLNLGNTLLERSYVSRAAADRDAALAAFRRAGEIVGTRHYRPRYWQAVVLGEMGRFEEAVGIVRDLRAGDDSGTTLYDEAEARLRRKQGQRAEAERLLLRVIAVKEKEGDPEPLLSLATWRFEDGDVPGAQAMIERALAIANGRRDLFRPYLYAARMLLVLRIPGTAEEAKGFLRNAVECGWTAQPEELEWVQGGPTPGAMRGTRGLPAYGRPR